jgi:hypothetical protein
MESDAGFPFKVKSGFVVLLTSRSAVAVTPAYTARMPAVPDERPWKFPWFPGWAVATVEFCELHAVVGSCVTFNCPPPQPGPSASYQVANCVALPIVTEAEGGAITRLGEQDELFAVQDASLPPFEPEQVQVHEVPDWETGEAEPAVQRLAFGDEANVWPFAEPQEPEVCVHAEQSSLPAPETDTQELFWHARWVGVVAGLPQTLPAPVQVFEPAPGIETHVPEESQPRWEETVLHWAPGELH